MSFDANNRYHRYLAAGGLIWGGCALCAVAGDKTVVGGAVALTIILGIVYVLRGED